MRLFIAILLEDHMKKALADAQDALRSRQFTGRYSDMRNLHLTLAFIGDYSDPDYILEAMEQLRFHPFDIALNGYIGNFGDILWAGLKHAPELEKHAKQLRHCLADARIPFDKKNFNPHITLLRNAHSSRTFSDVAIARAHMTVQRISLMRSDFGKHGAAYTEFGSIACEK